MSLEHTRKRIVSQAPTKEGLCAGGCGATILYRTNPKICCPLCRTLRKRESARRTAERKRRAKGIDPVKGLPAACARCGATFQLTTRRDTADCPPCRVERARERARITARSKKGVPGAHAKNTAWFKRKRHTDPKYAINFRFRAAIRRSLAGGKGGRRWEDLVGYRLTDLMIHLERQFQPGMTWGNRGEWEVDHIVPLTMFPFTSADDPEFRAAWALSNLRPLWAAENRTKNAHRTHLI